MYKYEKIAYRTTYTKSNMILLQMQMNIDNRIQIEIQIIKQLELTGAGRE